MFKKIRGLMVAGLLVIGMSGSVFAANESECVINGAGAHGEGENAHVHTIEYKDGVTSTEIERLLEEINGDTGNNKYYKAITVTAEKDDKGNDKLIVNVYLDANLDGEITEGQYGDKLVEQLVMTANNNVGVDKGWFEEIAPETGDAIALGGLVVVAIASVGLVIVNRKKRNK